MSVRVINLSPETIWSCWKSLQIVKYSSVFVAAHFLLEARKFSNLQAPFTSSNLDQLVSRLQKGPMYFLSDKLLFQTVSSLPGWGKTKQGSIFITFLYMQSKTSKASTSYKLVIRVEDIRGRLYLSNNVLAAECPAGYCKSSFHVFI